MRIYVATLTASVVFGAPTSPDNDGFFRIRNSDLIDQDTVRFTVLGDWGGVFFPPYRSPIQESAARLLTGVSARDQVDFNLAIGDNFYMTGVQSVRDHRWYSTYEQVYSDPVLQVPWYPVLGNHDWQGNITAQIDYSNYNWRWTMPDLYYTVSYNFAHDKTLTVIMIDTQIHCEPIGRPPVDARYYPIRPTEEMRTRQLDWLRNELEATKDHEYVMVVGHYPVHNQAFTYSCMSEIDALLKQYSVTAYSYGHQHQISHMVDKEEPKTQYLCSGYGALTELAKHKPTPDNPGNQNVDIEFIEMRLAGFNGGIMEATVTADSMLIEFYWEGNPKGALVPMHTVSLAPRK